MGNSNNKRLTEKEKYHKWLDKYEEFNKLINAKCLSPEEIQGALNGWGIIHGMAKYYLSELAAGKQLDSDIRLDTLPIVEKCMEIVNFFREEKISNNSDINNMKQTIDKDIPSQGLRALGKILAIDRKSVV